MYTVEYINGFALGYAVSSSAVPANDYHCEDDYEIMYVRSGSRRAFVTDASYLLSPGTLMFINRNELHKTARVSEEYERFVLNFTADYIFPNILDEMQILFDRRVYAPADVSFTDRIFFAVFSEWERLRKGDRIAAENIKCYLNILLTYYIRSGEELKDIGAKLDNPSVERLIAYMNDNFGDRITLADAANMLHLSQAYLSKLFFKYTGFGFSEYLKTIRIEHAKKLLETTGESIKDIAAECGFDDSNYFSTVFKKKTGKAPLQYKKMTHSR